MMPQTYHLEPELRTLHGYFSRDLAPVLTIDPGDTVLYRTPDAMFALMQKRYKVERIDAIALASLTVDPRVTQIVQRHGRRSRAAAARCASVIFL